MLITNRFVSSIGPDGIPTANVYRTSINEPISRVPLLRSTPPPLHPTSYTANKNAYPLVQLKVQSDSIQHSQNYHFRRSNAIDDEVMHVLINYFCHSLINISQINIVNSNLLSTYIKITMESNWNNNHMEDRNNGGRLRACDDIAPCITTLNTLNDQSRGAYYANTISKEHTQKNQNNSCNLDTNRMSNSHYYNSIKCADIRSLPVNDPITQVIKSLSSPESAYSTGYSTDGTSPGE